jgi:hypothetical protein
MGATKCIALTPEEECDVVQLVEVEALNVMEAS